MVKEIGIYPSSGEAKFANFDTRKDCSRQFGRGLGVNRIHSLIRFVLFRLPQFSLMRVQLFLFAFKHLFYTDFEPD